MKNFYVSEEDIGMPPGSSPRLRRIQVDRAGAPIVALTQGQYRCYLYPVYSPAGVALTAESPVDHPHHNSITVGADVVRALLPPLLPDLSGCYEEATYNLYVNEVFQGRAPGRIWSVGVDYEEISSRHLRFVQRTQWQGPQEWGAEDGRRVVAEEERNIDIRVRAEAYVIDIRSRLRATSWDLRIGPTRHAYFTVRLADNLRPLAGGCLTDAVGRVGAEAINGRSASWVDMSGLASHGCRAGITVIPLASTANLPWIVADWGAITLNPFLKEQGVLDRGQTLDFSVRIIAHDGDVEEANVARLYAVLSDADL